MFGSLWNTQWQEFILPLWAKAVFNTNFKFPIKNQRQRLTVPFKKLILKWILRKQEGHGMNSSGSIKSLLAG